MSLLGPLRLGPRLSRNRVVFGPHETNLARGRAISDRHAAYYARRAAGGAGVIVVEEASVHPSDWPYERCPLARECGPGWRTVVDACRAEADDVLVVAALGHSGGQGSSAYSQAPMWAPSRVPEVNTREVPKSMEAADIAAVVDGFVSAARLASESGCDGVEINAGQFSLLRQFLSGLTNQRGDDWGTDKQKFLRDVLVSVREAIGSLKIVGLRLSCDELAPWAGITPEAAVDLAADLAGYVNYVTVVRGAIFSVSATRPDGHTPAGFNFDLARSVRAGLPPEVAVIAQGSIVDWHQASWAIGAQVCDAVEMTRAQIADAELVAKGTRDEIDRIRPCLLCNQTCQVRDARNPIVTCVVDPRSGYETTEPPVVSGATGRDVVVIGGGLAGLEAARVATIGGHNVTVVEASEDLGGVVRTAARGAGRERLATIADWLVAECSRLGVKLETGRTVDTAEIAALEADGRHVVLANGGTAGRRDFTVDDAADVRTAADALDGPMPDGSVLVWDPIGGPIGVSIAELFRHHGCDVRLVTPDNIAGNELARSGDLAPANQRMQSSGVVLERRSILRTVAGTTITLEDRYTGDRRTVEADLVIDAGHRLPDDGLWKATGERLPRAGDAVAPRTIAEAIREGRRRAQEVPR